MASVGHGCSFLGSQPVDRALLSEDAAGHRVRGRKQGFASPEVCFSVMNLGVECHGDFSDCCSLHPPKLPARTQWDRACDALRAQRWVSGRLSTRLSCGRPRPALQDTGRTQLPLEGPRSGGTQGARAHRPVVAVY